MRNSRSAYHIKFNITAQFAQDSQTQTFKFDIIHSFYEI
jgi:hypothetical protein